MEKYTGKIYVVFKTAADMDKVTAAPEDNILVDTFVSLFSCCFDASRLWKFERAPEPTDINWQNLGIGLCRRICQTTMVYLITGILLAVCGVIIWAIKKAKDAEVEDFKRTWGSVDDAPLAERGYIQAVGAMSSVSIAVLNESLKLVMRRLSVTERT